ncbi:MAG: 16S rRNA (guanine(966)-N(2))-methyltransferase RsmD [Chloroflexi bacterium]|nr:16S rRNA (guanine(966)-N(2))-methyltransferase RsmD [Chloroflexota bacterium]
MGPRIIGGESQGRRLRTAKDTGVRPTSDLVRGAVFSILAQRVEGARVLDLFAGSGALGVEALSRGAAWADFVEAVPHRASAIRATLRELGYGDRARVYAAKAERAPAILQGPYHLIFLDPPYEYPGLADLLLQIAASSLLMLGGLMTVEHSRRQELPEAFDGTALVKQRRYGDTVISIYQRGGRPW